MNPGEDKSVNSDSTTSASWFVVGSVLSVLSAFALAWSGTACVDVLKILVARDLSELLALGQRLGRVSWCPFGVAVGTTLIAAGFRLTATRGRLSQRAMVFVALYGVIAAGAGFFLLLGTSQARGTMMVVAASDQAVKPEEVRAVLSQATATVSRGWMLLVVAQVLLSIGGLVQLADQSKSFVGSLRWHKMANLALSLLWIFGAIASIEWFRRSWEILELRTGEPIKALAIVEMLDGVVSLSCLSSLFLLCHAVLTTIVVAVLYRTLAKRPGT